MTCLRCRELEAQLRLTEVGLAHYRSEKKIHDKEHSTFTDEMLERFKAHCQEIESLKAEVERLKPLAKKYEDALARAKEINDSPLRTYDAHLKRSTE